MASRNDEISICNCNGLGCAAKVPLLSALSREDLQKVNALIVRYTYKKGDTILRLGSSFGKFMIVRKGKIKISTLSPDGREQILYILTAGDFFGEYNLLRNKAEDYQAQVMEDTVVCTIEKKDFEQLLIEYPNISIRILEGLSDRLERMESLVKTISPKDVDLRVSMLLMDLSHRYGQTTRDGIIVEIPMSREEMANYVGIARETLIRKLTTLKEYGIIDFIGRRKMKILDVSLLETDIRNSSAFI